MFKKYFLQHNIRLSVKNLKSIASLLSSVLADAAVLYSKARKFQWNGSGNSFMELDELFECQYKILYGSAYEIAEIFTAIFIQWL